MSDLSTEVQIDVEPVNTPTYEGKELLEGSHSHSKIYIDKEKGEIVKIFNDPTLEENIKQYELYKKFGESSPLLSSYFKNVLPDGKGLVLKFIPDSELLDDLGRAGTLKLTEEEKNKALDDLKEHQHLTNSIMYGQDIHDENVRVQTLPDGTHKIYLMDVGGIVDGETSPEEFAQELDTYRRLLNNNSL